MRKENKKYDIFISYRRDGGVETARLIYDRLTRLGYRVSFDMETLRSGKFNTQLYERIDQCKDMLVLLSNKALELRDNPSEDWFRLEVAHALKHQKNIIPVFLRDFTWPEKKMLPDDISELYDYEGVSASDEHFDSTVKKLCDLLISKPSQHSSCLYCLLSIVFISLICLSITYCFKHTFFHYPFTQEEKQQWSEIQYVLFGQGTCINQLFGLRKRLLETAENSINIGMKSSFSEEYEIFLNGWRNINIHQWLKSDKILNYVKKSPIQISNFKAIEEYLKYYYMETKEDAILLNNYFKDNYSPLSIKSLLDYIQIERECLDLDMKYYSYLQMELFKDVSLENIVKYRESTRIWTNLPLLTGPWSQDEEKLQYCKKLCLKSIETKFNEQRKIFINTNIVLNDDFDNNLHNKIIHIQNIEKISLRKDDIASEKIAFLPIVRDIYTKVEYIVSAPFTQRLSTVGSSDVGAFDTKESGIQMLMLESKETGSAIKDDDGK